MNHDCEISNHDCLFSQYFGPFSNSAILRFPLWVANDSEVTTIVRSIWIVISLTISICPLKAAWIGFTPEFLGVIWIVIKIHAKRIVSRVSKFAAENVFNSNATIVVLNSTKTTAINDNEI